VGDGFEQPAQLGATFLGDAAQLRAWVGDTPAVTDDRPKRIRADVRFDQPFDAYATWLVADGARRRFEASPWVAAHWPKELIGWTPQYFAVQPVLNAQIDPHPVNSLGDVDILLRMTDLRIPVLWLLDSDMTEQGIVDRRLADSATGMRTEYAFTLGARALADRDFPRAAAFLTQAAERNPARAGAVAAYALCRAGAPRRAAAVRGAQQLMPKLRCWK
jgi:hypothetical protein